MLHLQSGGTIVQLIIKDSPRATKRYDIRYDDDDDNDVTYAACGQCEE
jgi:hypothetical protein